MEFSSKKLSLSNSSIPTPKFSQNNGQTLEVLFSRFDFSRLLQWLLFLVDAKEEPFSADEVDCYGCEVWCFGGLADLGSRR